MQMACHPRHHSHVVAVGASERIIEGVLEDGTLRLDKALAEASGLSRERVKALLGEGRVLVDGVPASQGSAKLPEGTRRAIQIPEAIPASAMAQNIALVIAYEDEHLIVIDKPAGLVASDHHRLGHAARCQRR